MKLEPHPFHDGAQSALAPDAAFRGAGDLEPLPAHQTYYDRPLLKRPHWDASVITYLFLGGLMGGTGILVALADPDDDAELARNARYLAFALAATCPPVLISHLGRPERFYHMLRIVKFRSPMSMGSWGLVLFALPATLAAGAQLAADGILPDGWRPLRHLGDRRLVGAPLALLGGFICGYTGVLISATAIPLWAKGKRYIPAFSVCSGIAGACALNGALLALSGGERAARSRKKLERLELVAGLAELALLVAFERHAGELGAPMFAGERGTQLKRSTELFGIAVPALLGLLPFENRAKTLVASALALFGGYVLRRTLIEAGKGSADDPRAASRQPE